MSDKSLHELRQEAFDKAYLGLASQGFEASMDADTNCFYRGPNGRRCAVGWLIPDDKYDPSLEGHTIDFSEPVKRALGLTSEHREMIPFLAVLQNDHDFAPTPEAMKAGLGATAKEFNLTIPEIPQNG